MIKQLILKKGVEFGSWLVISDVTKRKNNLTHWKCRCVCGTEKFVPLNNLMNGSSTQCKECSQKKSAKKKRKGCGDLSGDHWARIKSKIKKKHPSFSTTKEAAWNKFLEQDKACFLTGRQIELSGYPYDPEKTTAEYVIMEGNVEAWVKKDVALILTHMTSFQLIEMALEIANEFSKKDDY